MTKRFGDHELDSYIHYNYYNAVGRRYWVIEFDDTKVYFSSMAAARAYVKKRLDENAQADAEGDTFEVHYRGFKFIVPEGVHLELDGNTATITVVEE
jgi:hypothetical protein